MALQVRRSSIRQLFFGKGSLWSDSPSSAHSAQAAIASSLSLRGLLWTLLVLVSPGCFAGTHTSSITATSNGILMQYITELQTVSYQLTMPSSGSKGLIGTFSIAQSTSGSPQGELTLVPLITGYQGGLYLKAATVGTSSSGTPCISLSFVNPIGTTHITLTPFFDRSTAAIRLDADNSSIFSIDLSSWNPSVGGTDISVPYYTKPVQYFASLNVFANAYFDPFESNASTFYGNETVYASKTDGTANPLHDVIKLAVSNNIVDVLPYINNAASPFMAELAGRLVIDIRSGGMFNTIAQQISTLGDYGITHCVDLVHMWQYMGYDNGLPMHLHAGDDRGGPAAMEEVSAASQASSCLFGLHENYTDYYPNYPSYTSASTMLNSDSSQGLGWYNSTTGIQAFLTKPNLFVKSASTQSPLIHANYGTTAMFLDVNSAIPPWYRSDKDASAPRAGTFAAYRDNMSLLWAYERKVNAGPVFGEGKDHWFWSGDLDGVEAQFGAESTPIVDGTKAPLFVDFDLLRIHPLQVNYGMGYYNRWLTPAGDITSTASLDAYRMQEIIFGHAAYLTDPLWSSVPRAMLEMNLVTPVAARYALQTPTKISYQVGGAWGDASAAAKAGDFSVAQVNYPNGDQFVANSKATTLSWKGLELPQYGWAATGKNFQAYTAYIGGSIADYAATGTFLYANARNQTDLVQSTSLAVPSMTGFSQTSANVFAYQLSWGVLNPDSTQNYTAFVHFVPVANPGIDAGNSGNTPLVPTQNWTAGQVVLSPTTKFYLPTTMGNGAYTVRVGLFNASGRATLWGNDDGTLRYTVGTLTVAVSGASLTFVPQAPPAVGIPDLRMNSSGGVVDFGTVRTDGMVSLQAGTGSEANAWTLRSYPRSRDVIMQIKSSVLAMPASINCTGGKVLNPSSLDNGAYWQVSLRGLKSCSWDGADSLTFQ